MGPISAIGWTLFTKEPRPALYSDRIVVTFYYKIQLHGNFNGLALVQDYASADNYLSFS